MSKKILVIDNNSNFLELIEQALIFGGFKVAAFAVIDNVLKTIHETKPDLILMDYLLWGVNGDDLCSQVKHNPQTAQLPIILMSAYCRVLQSMGTYDCDEFIEKPFNMDHLIERINYHLKEIKQKDIGK